MNRENFHLYREPFVQSPRQGLIFPERRNGRVCPRGARRRTDGSKTYVYYDFGPAAKPTMTMTLVPGISLRAAREATLQIDLACIPDLASLRKRTKHGDSKAQDEEPVSMFGGLCGIVADVPPSLYLDGAALHLNLGPCRSFRATYRSYTQRRPKTGLYAEVVYRK